MIKNIIWSFTLTLMITPSTPEHLTYYQIKKLVSESERAKRLEKANEKKNGLTFADYKTCLDTNKYSYLTINIIRSKGHTIY